MCVVSMIHDHFYDEWKDRAPWKTLPYSPYPYPLPISPPPWDTIPPLLDPVPYYPDYKKTGPVTEEEIEEFRRLLERAREYDKKNNEPDCELDEKRKKIKELADKLGIEIDFI